jgi:hypothetical protein
VSRADKATHYSADHRGEWVLHEDTPAVLRTVHLATGNDTFKALYYDREKLSLRPDLTFVDSSGSIVFATNEIGLKGEPLDPERRLAIVWGDSVVFGSGWSWPCLLDPLAPGWQFLNGGLDGDPYSNILRRAGEFNRRYPVELNLLMLGWHDFVPARLGAAASRPHWFSRWTKAPAEIWQPHSGNENLRTELTSFLEHTPNTVVLTTPTALNRQIIDHDLSSCLVAGDDAAGFRFLSDFPPRIESQRQLFDHIAERNAIADEVCTRLGIRIIDVFARFGTENAADFREHFYDVLHFRPRSYPLLTQFIYEEIKDLLG